MLVAYCFVGAMCLIVFLLYFPTIDANDSGEEEVDRTRILLYCWNYYLMELKKSRDK